MKIYSSQKIRSLLFITALGICSASCANDNNDNKDAAAESAGSKEDTLLHGEKTHSEHCYKCHTDDVYTREDRFVKSIDALSKQVVRCKDNTGAPWFDEDTDAVVQFLNNKYYRF